MRGKGGLKLRHVINYQSEFMRYKSGSTLREVFEKTRLSYNCAHLRSTKDSLTIEYVRIIKKKIGVKILWVKIFCVKIFWVKIRCG